MRHQAQNGFMGIFVRIIQHKKGHLVYVPHKGKIISSYKGVFDDSFYSALVYASQPYTEYMAIQPAVLYIPYATFSKKHTDDIIT